MNEKAKFVQRIAVEVQAEYERLKRECSTVGELKAEIDKYFQYPSENKSISHGIKRQMEDFFEKDILSCQKTIVPAKRFKISRRMRRILNFIIGIIAGVIAAKVLCILLTTIVK